ncbi:PHOSPHATIDYLINOSITOL 4-PHOSPHATE 5-KINASE 10 [Salix purpurea]|uniref:1-phosphatidylinositol-4-phosphate 5-kinase n=1 Tax=Salix purpurea TaxID=77065 RepID=A0A9Q0P1T2_SALPP|nr:PHOSPHATIDYLINOSITOL 4-PHOSPHATE 5-KINASE 10 [Salix purpurea]
MGYRHFEGQQMTMYFKDLPSLAFRDAQRNTVRYRKQDPGCVDDRVYSDYKCKDYCPDVFRRIQKLRNIDRSDYMMSIRSDLTIREIFSAGKYTSAIPVSIDDRLVVAVVPKSEKKAMLQMLPSYCFHLEMNRDSLLSILYGIHYMKPIGGPKVYFSVYSRVIPSDANIFRVFDLKGSWKGRKINKPRAKENSILKDMDFSFRFYLDPLIHEKLLGQIKHDCDFLEAQGIMDYSLLIGIALPPQDKDSVDSRSSYSEVTFPCHSPVNSNGSINSNVQNTGHGDSSTVNSADSSSLESERISSCSSEEVEGTQSVHSHISEEPDSSEFRLGVGMPARTIRSELMKAGHVSSTRSAGGPECTDVVLYFSIVDIFQNYNLAKRLEHAYKSIKYDSRSIVTVNPKAYASRFQDFMSMIFHVDY